MQKQSDILNALSHIKRDHLKVCVFGCGNLGTGPGYEILKFLEIEINYFSDNDSELWGKK